MPPAEQLFAENLALHGKVANLEEKVVGLETQVAWLKKQLFGGGKGESLDRAQLLLALGQIEAQIKASAPQTVTYERAPAKRVGVHESFEKLPVHETVEIIPDEVKADPELYERIGEERTFEVDLIPPKLVKRVIVRPKYRHRLDRTRPPLVAPAPSRPVMGGYASAGLLASIVVSKYVHHVPLFRQEKMSARWGARLSRRSMADWVAFTAQWLRPIYLRMKEQLLSGHYVQADETPIRCQDPDEPTGKTFQGYLWAISRPDDDVVFDWRLTRQHGEITTLLDGFKGVLQSDGYEGYQRYAEKNPGVIRVACFAHARRKFNEALDTAPIQAGFMMRLIGHLYRMEREWDERKINPGERTRLRTRDFELTLRLMKKAAVLLARRSLPQSNLGKACRYLLGQWDALVAHCDHGETRIDTNLLENAIRPSAIGKRNFLFIGHPNAGDRSAIIYSIVVSCQRRGIDPLDYIRDVLKRLPSMTTRDDLTPLLPRKWKPGVS
jgi:transposase